MTNNGLISPDQVLWTDESIFTVNGMFNKQNYRLWSQENPHWITESRFHITEKVMAWTGIIGENVIGPYFFDDKLTAVSYLQMLNDLLLPELQRLNIGKNRIWFMPDGAKAHYAVQVRAFLDREFPNWIGREGGIAWPDLTPMDFSIWGFIKSQVYRTRPINRVDLIEKITDAHGRISPQILQNTYNGVINRLRTCIEQNGGYIGTFR